MNRHNARGHEMSTQPPRRINQDTAEQLLAGDPAALHRVGGLAVPLRAARGPVHPDELAGEQAALAAFQAAADLTPVPQPRRLSMLKIALAKLLTVKAAAIIAASGVGGVALAASTGVLPNPLVDTPASPPATHALATPTTTPSHPGAPGAAAGSPSPSLLGLCQAHAAGAAANPGKALDNPAFTVLITAAGGADHVEEYCDTMAAAASASATHPGNAPTGGGRPTAVPTPTAAGGAPGSRPDMPAAERPAGNPTAIPSGAPTTPNTPAGR
jgi:hypothetical protein